MRTEFGFDEDALIAGVDLVERCGAKAFEVGHVHDDVPIEQAGWWASAEWNGRKEFVDKHRGPVEAVEALARRLLEGGMCTHCRQKITLTGGVGDDVCRWTRMGRKWRRGCETPARRNDATNRAPKRRKRHARRR